MNGLIVSPMIRKYAISRITQLPKIYTVVTETAVRLYPHSMQCKELQSVSSQVVMVKVTVVMVAGIALY
jgi:predicted nucleotidyltransferase